MSDQKEQDQALPSTSKEESKQLKDVNSLMLISDSSKEFPELRDKPTVEVDSKSHSKPLQRDFIPEEIFVALTSAANPIQYPPFLKPPKKTKSFDFQGCIRTADGVWQHPIRRNKFRYLIQHPVCLTGAGRDVSFLYDVISQKGSKVPASGAVPHKNLKEDANATKPATNVADTFVPEEFHIVKNRGILGLEYYDDKYTTLLEDEESRLRVFPSMKPCGRLEVLQLMKVMDTMLEKAGTNDENVGVTGLSQMHNILDVMKVEQNIYNIVFHEIIRQVSIDCAERGELLSKLRQKYVELLERIPRQMRTLYREMMAQRVMDKHITDELFHFKQAVGQLTRELNTIRQHDHRTTFEAEKAYRELAKAVKESEMNANLLDEYRELYELQRSRLEAQIHQLTLEKELWSNATYDIALKVVEKNKLILARRMYDSEKTWVKGMRHFIMLLASQDSTDLSNLQRWTQEFRELMRDTDEQVEQVEETTRERTRSIQNGLTGWLNYFQNHVLGKGTYNFEKGATLLEQILVDLKVWEKMLNDELTQYGGDMLLLRQEPLRMATKLQKRWVDLGVAMHDRHKDLQGRRPVESKMLEEINKDCTHLNEQYCTRVNGENGSAKIVINLVNSLEEWTFKLLSGKQKVGLYEADWINFFEAVSDWLVQLEELLKITGTAETLQERKLKKFVPVISEDVFKKIQNWLLTTTTSSERENTQLSRELTDFHNVLSKWMVKLLMNMVPEHTCPDTIPLTDTEISMQAERKMLNTLNLEKEVMGLAAQMSQFSSYLVSCCKEMVAATTRKRLATSHPDAEYELQQLEKIKTECLDWIETCNFLLSGMKATKAAKLIDKKELIYYFGSEVFQQKRKLPPHPEQTLESASFIQAEEIPDEVKKMEKAGSTQSPEKEPTLEIQQAKPSVPATSSEIPDESPEIDYQMRYIAHDANVYCKTLTAEKISVSGRELYASQPTTEFSKKEFQILASLEILEERLIEAEKRALEAEEKSEALHEELEEALKKLQDMEDEEPELKEFGKKAEKSDTGPWVCRPYALLQLIKNSAQRDNQGQSNLSLSQL